MPALLKLLAAFALILTLNRLRLHLGLCLVAGALLLGLWVNPSPSLWLQAAAGTLWSGPTLVLVLTVGMILILSRLLAESGQLDRIVGHLRAFLPDERWIVAIMPALIGLLPMPGGALFSAPIVQSACPSAGVNNELRATLNYWFRHIWEYWWPLYPGVALAIVLLNVETWQYMLFMAPLTVLSLLAGVVFLMPRLPPAPPRDAARPARRGAFLHLLMDLMPILAIILTIAGLALLEKLAGLAGLKVQLPAGFAIVPALALALAWVIRANRMSAARVSAAVRDRRILSMLVLVAAVMFFKEMLAATGAVAQIQTELVAAGLPLAWLIGAIPFLAGLMTGIAVGFVGTAFPLVLPMFPHTGLTEYMAYALLAYTCGYMGMMLSPVHLCLVVSKDYFGARFPATYRLLLPPALSVMAVGVLLFWLLT